MKQLKFISFLGAAFTALQLSVPASAASENEFTYFCDNDYEAIFTIELSEEETNRAIQRIETDYQACTETNNNKSSLYNCSTDYYYNQLNEEGKAFYDNLVTCCEVFAASAVDITDTTNSGNGLFGYVYYDSTVFTYDELREIYYAFYYSNPQFFFLANGFATGQIGSSRVLFPIVENEGPDFLKYSSRSEYAACISQVTAQWMQEINACSDDYEKERLICEKLCNHITYTFSGIDQSLAGALVDKACVCNGYAMAVTYFCNAAGIDCITVVSENHAWNRVKLYNNWYEVDTTWMDQGGYILYDWFNKSNATFAANDLDYMHTIDTEYYDDFFTLPVCTADCIDEIGTPQFSDVITSAQQVTLYWNSVENATSYRIYRADSYEGSKKLLKAVNTTTYTDTTAEEGKSYYYFVKAYSGNFNMLSNYSEGYLAEIPVTPEGPANVKAVSGGGNATITWDAVEDATSYRVFRSTSLTGTRTLEKVRTSTYYIDTNVDTGTTYYYWIVTYNADTGCKSDYSSVSKVTVTDNFSETIEIGSVSVLSTSVTLNWDIIPGATSYRIYRRNDDGTRKLLAAQSMTEYKDTGLTKGKIYKYEIRAYSATTKALTDYSAIRNVRPIAATVILSGNVKGKITWDNNLYASSFRVFRAESLTGEKKFLTATKSLTYTDTTAESGKLYYYFVAVYDNVTGTLSAYSNPKAIRIA